MNLSTGQQRAIDDLHVIAAHGGPVVLHVGEIDRAGSLPVDLNFDCAGVQRAEHGLRLRRFERLRVLVPRDFPHRVPTLVTPHRRWAKTAHVQWGRQVCLYRSPPVEWDPADGMFGYVERVLLWLARAAAGELDPAGQPLHPPVAYELYDGGGALVICANAPRAEPGTPWLGAALLRAGGPSRVDVVGWHRLGSGSWLDLAKAAEARGRPTFHAAAVILPAPIGFEMPLTAGWLAALLANQGAPRDLTLGLLGLAASINDLFAQQRSDDPYPLYALVGTPSRGVVGQQTVTHLCAWRIPDDTAPLLAAVPAALSDDGETRAAEVGESVLMRAKRWLDASRVHWVTVYEMRPETTVRRDEGSPARWLGGRSVLVLGTGALGGPVAEACVRGGAASVAVADNGRVHPGIIVRQRFEDGDIGEWKAVALARRLARISPDVTIIPVVEDVVTLLAEGANAPAVDLVIDATANRIVRHVIETRRRASPWPPVITVMVGQDAQRGVATVSCDDSAGGPADILRRLGIRVRTSNSGQLADVADDFYADPPRTDLFEPEPGCSSPTFRGGAAQLDGQAGHLLTGALAVLESYCAGQTDHPMHAIVIRAIATVELGRQGGEYLSWPCDTMIADAAGEYQIRLSSAAVSEIRAECRRGVRVREPQVETGGLLLGQFDDAAGIVWVDAASGPPPDSRLSPLHFEHGAAGAADIPATQMRRTARTSGFVGMWHSHPDGIAWPSETDQLGMASLVGVVEGQRRAVILIVGGPTGWSDWLAGNDDPDWYARVVDRPSVSGSATAPACPPAVRDDAPWWPGGFATARRGPRTPAYSRTRRAGLRIRWLLRRVK